MHCFEGNMDFDRDYSDSRGFDFGTGCFADRGTDFDTGPGWEMRRFGDIDIGFGMNTDFPCNNSGRALGGF